MSRHVSLGAKFARRDDKNAHVTSPTEPLDLPQPVMLDFGDFSGGYDVSKSEQESAPNTTPYALDILVNRRGKLAPMAGVSNLEVPLAQTPTGMAAHPNFDFSTELVFFAPPFLGVKADGATVWTNLGLPAGELFGSTVYAQTFLFSNAKVGTYAREPQGVATLIPGFPAGEVLTTFAARVLAFAVGIGDSFEPMGVWWTGPNGHDDTGLNSGFELLISDTPVADRVRAAIPLGFDTLAILCRHSIWIGRPTGLLERPVDFQSRIRGIGVYGRRTAAATRFGVLALSDDGVRLFDGNDFSLVSQAINHHLLPLDPDEEDSYSAFVDPSSGYYFLFTPRETWILDIENKRWFRWSAVISDAAHFPEQVPGGAETWDDMGTTQWDAAVGTWSDFSPFEGSPRIVMRRGTSLGILDSATRSVFTTPMTPLWTTPKPKDQQPRMVYSAKEIHLDYEGEATVTFLMPDHKGNFVEVRTRELPPDAIGAEIGVRHTGIGASVRLKIDEGSIEIGRIGLVTMPRAPQRGRL